MQPSSATRVVSANWFEEEGDALVQTLSTVFGHVRDENEWRTDADDFHWGLYEGTGFGGVRMSSAKGCTYVGATLPDNLAKMAVDTLTAKVASIRPIPQVHADRGSWKDGRRAKKIRQYIRGCFHQHKIHEQLAPRIVKDALVGRAGVVQVYREKKRTFVERVFPWEIYVDEWDARCGEPRALFRLREMNREVAIKKYGKKDPKKIAALKNAGFFSSTSRTQDASRWSTVEKVELLEAWYRCTDHDPDDPDHECTGRHVLICDGALLEEEVWKRDGFPFAILTFDDPNTGFWGTGLVKTLEGAQVEINLTNERLSESYRMSGKGVIIRDGSGIYDPEIVNGLFVWHAKPGPYDPTVFDLDLVNEHMRARPSELIDRGLAAVGLSQMAAQAKKPAGVTAAVALQTLDDIESQRHVVIGRKYESFCMQIARLLIDDVKDIAEEYGDHEVRVPMRGAYLPLKWSDVRIDGFQLEMETVGNLFLGFTGKLDKLQALFEKGLIDGTTFMRHLDAGDLQAELDLETVNQVLVDEMLERMLDNENEQNPDDDYIGPIGELPLAWAIKRTHQTKLKAAMEGAPKNVLRLLTRFSEDLVLLEKGPAANNQNQTNPTIDPNAPPPPDGGVPMPPPNDMPPPMGAPPPGVPGDALPIAA